MTTENSGLRVVANRQVDGGHWYYADGLSSDPRAEHLVRFSDASLLVAELQAEIERLREERDEVITREEMIHAEVENALAYIAELEAREQQRMDARVPFPTPLRHHEQ